LATEVRMAENQEASGAANTIGNKRIPAPVGDVPLTIWKRCGKPITAPKNENPVKNVDLRSPYQPESRED